MIYFDNAATTWPKPEKVKRALVDAVEIYGANPARGSHEMALRVSRLILETRQQLAKLFNVSDANRIVFTANATESINLALKGFLLPGDNVVFSSMEHNAVYRPLKWLESHGVTLKQVDADCQGFVDPEAIERAITAHTKLVVITHGSNVTGTIMPISEIGEITKRKNVRLMVDAAQTAGYLDIDVVKQGIDLLAFPGHKGLYGITGIGGLYIGEGIDLLPLKQGGTGSSSHHWQMPDVLPDRFESGTLNTVGIAALKAGLDFLEEVGLAHIREHEAVLTKKFMQGVAKLHRAKIYGPELGVSRCPVVSINLGDTDPGEVAFMLDKIYGIAVRPGFHCAPLAHQTIGTAAQGTIRFSFGWFNTMKEIDTAINALENITKELER